MHFHYRQKNLKWYEKTEFLLQNCKTYKITEFTYRLPSYFKVYTLLHTSNLQWLHIPTLSTILNTIYLRTNTSNVQMQRTLWYTLARRHRQFSHCNLKNDSIIFFLKGYCISFFCFSIACSHRQIAEPICRKATTRIDTYLKELKIYRKVKREILSQL